MVKKWKIYNTYTCDQQWLILQFTWYKLTTLEIIIFVT